MLRLVYGISLFAYLAIIARSVFYRSSWCYEKILVVLLFRVFELGLKIVFEVTEERAFYLIGCLFFTCFSLAFFDVLVNVCNGRTLMTRKLFWMRVLLFSPFLVSSLFHGLNPEKFSTFLVVTEGVIFLYLVKKTLDMISRILEHLNSNDDMLNQKDFYIIFLVLLYLYFIEDLVKICSQALIIRFYSSQNNRFSLVLIFIDEILKVIILSIFFNHLRESIPVFFPSHLVIFQANLFPTPLENLSIPCLCLSNSSLLLLTPFPF